MSLKLQNVLITDQVDPKCVKILESNGVNVVVDTGLAKDKARLIQEIPVCAFAISTPRPHAISVEHVLDMRKAVVWLNAWQHRV